MGINDTRCHRNVSFLGADREQVRASGRSHGVSAIVVSGVHAADWPGLRRIRKAHD
jgi:hypothetical protein